MELQISSETYFTYDGHQSYLHGLRFAWIENSPETNMVSEKKYSTIKNNSQNLFMVSKSTYEESLEFDGEIVSDRILSDGEVRRVFNKFFDKNQFKELILPVNNENIHLNCVMTNIEKTEGGLGDSYGVIGFRLKIICDAPWGWTDYKSKAVEIDSSTGKFIIRNQSDSQDYIYPTVTVKVPLASAATNNTRIYPETTGNEYSCQGCPLVSQCIGNATEYPLYMGSTDRAEILANMGTDSIPHKVMIKNLTDDELKGLCIICRTTATQTITMDPFTGAITGTDGESTTVVSKAGYTNKKFIRLLPGDNTFYTENLSTGDLTISFREARILV